MTEKLANELKVVDGIKTQDGQKFYKYVGPDGGAWISDGNLMTADIIALKSMAVRTGVSLLSPASRAAAIKLAEGWRVFRDGVVAEQPGWHGKAYVCGNAKVISAPADTTEYLAAFDYPARFEPRGTVEDWQQALAQFVVGQPFLAFLLGYSLCPIVLPLFPNFVLNPIIELVGGGSCGKTSGQIAAMSIWGVDLTSTSGGAPTWDVTERGYKDLRLEHNGMLLPVDEGEAITNAKARLDMVKSVAFGTSSTESRRTAVDKGPGKAIRNALLYTSNTSLANLLSNEPEDRRDAALSRVLTIAMSKNASTEEISLFQSIPSGFGDAEAATQALVLAAGRFFGTAAPAFAKFVVEHRYGSLEFEEKTRADFAAAKARLTTLMPETPERIVNTLATVEVTLCLAIKAGVIPISWPSGTKAVKAVRDHLRKRKPQSIEEEFDAWVKAKRKYSILPKSQLHRYLQSPEEPLSTQFPGVFHIEQDGKFVYLLPCFVDAHFGVRSNRLLKTLKQKGRLMQHASEMDRFTIKAPTSLRKYGFGRVYKVAIAV